MVNWDQTSSKIWLRRRFSAVKGGKTCEREERDRRKERARERARRRGREKKARKALPPWKKQENGRVECERIFKTDRPSV